MTINESWGYNKDDNQWKSGRQLIHTLCEVAGRGGNLLLNVSPTGDGVLPPEIEDRLDAVQAWMARHAESIVGTSPGLAAWQHYGPSTRRGNRVYAHVLLRPYDSVTLRGVRIGRARAATALGTNTPLTFTKRASIVDSMMRNPDAVGELTIAVPQEAIDEHATVLALDFEGEPY
jgi:alpha-L-fucosidase